MGATYKVLGKSVPAYLLAIATISSVVFLVVPKPWNKNKAVHPPINASTLEEEAFVKDYVAQRAPKH